MSGKMRVVEFDVLLSLTTKRGATVTIHGRTTGRAEALAGSVFPGRVEVKVGSQRLWIWRDDVLDGDGLIVDWRAA